MLNVVAPSITHSCRTCSQFRMSLSLTKPGSKQREGVKWFFSCRGLKRGRTLDLDVFSRKTFFSWKNDFENCFWQLCIRSRPLQDQSAKLKNPKMTKCVKERGFLVYLSVGALLYVCMWECSYMYVCGNAPTCLCVVMLIDVYMWNISVCCNALRCLSVGMLLDVSFMRTLLDVIMWACF